MVGQHLSGRRGRRGLAPLLLLVQAPSVDPHPRPPARAAEVPRGDGRRVRHPAPPAAGRHRRVGDVGRRASRLDRPPRRRHGRRVPRADQRRRLPQRASVPRLARARGLRGPGVPHRPLGARARPGRQGGGRGRHRFVGHPGRARPPADRAAPVRVPAGARVGAAQGRARLQRRGADRPQPSVAQQAGALATALDAGEVPVERPPLAPGHQAQQGPRGHVPALHRPGVQGPSRPARGRHPVVPVPGQAAGDRLHLLSRSQEGERDARRQGGVVGDPHRGRRRRRGRACRRRRRAGHRVPGRRLPRPSEGRGP